MKAALVSYMVFFIAAFLADQLPFLSAIKRVSQLSMNSVETMRSVIIHDDAKQQILLSNSYKLFVQSLKIIALVMFIVACCALLLLLVTVFFKTQNFRSLTNAVISVNGLMISIVAFVSYFLLKKLYGKVRL